MRGVNEREVVVVLYEPFDQSIIAIDWLDADSPLEKRPEIDRQ
jgi:hypothetical protein